ncbi:hypothetical protein AB6G29_03905 [Providencia hangzhouensis]|uniref:hypothetical protein n=1 Tax=Providencia hangzhouensis TaxID=3031799 RepID=UPI0034DD2046
MINLLIKETGTPIAWYLKNNYDLFMYERGYELIEEQKDIILKDKDLCDLIYTVHMKYVKYKDEIDIKIGNVHDLINYQENELFYSDKIDLKNKIKLEVLEKDILIIEGKKGQLVIILMSLLRKKMMLLEYMRSLKKYKSLKLFMIIWKVKVPSTLLLQMD